MTEETLHGVLDGHPADHPAYRFRPGDGADPVELTYGELDAASNRLAHVLGGAGVVPGDVVAVLLDRGPDLAVAQLAVLKAGAVWSPLDPQHPPARLGLQVADAAVALVLTSTDLAATAADAAAGTPAWPLDDSAQRQRAAAAPDTAPDVEVRPGDGAYLIYTSGSTGHPKGVLVSHRSARTFSRIARDVYGLGPGDRIPQVANPAFDVTVFDTFATLHAGATVVSAPRTTLTDPDGLTALVRDERVTVAYLPPALLALLDPKEFGDTALRAVMCAGAVLPTELANRWIRPGLVLHNSYGPTETTVLCTSRTVGPEPLEGAVPIGLPLPHHRAYVLDRKLRPAPIGVAGQLWISGSGVAHGYLGRPGLTAERFVADPFGPDPLTGLPGGRMYATGDLARRGPDGSLEFLGRADRQVKLNGQRIELGEIEQALATHPAVRQSVVLLRGETLAAYLVTDGDIDPGALRGHLADRLPVYMIPSTFTVLTELPLTPNGKLDTAQLPDPDRAAGTHVEPATPTERWLAATWQELLHAERVGAGDNFFGLGANSLHATQLTARIRDGLGIELQLRDLFDGHSLAELAARLDAAEQTGPAEPIVAGHRDGQVLPCTFQQESLWFLNRLDPAASTYHLPAALRLRGPLDVLALEEALQALIVRHDALRTRFVESDGLPRQVVDPAPAACALPVRHLREPGVEAWVAEVSSEPFDLAAGFLFRAALAQVGRDEHVLVLVVHHIVADGWSLRILAEELSQLYRAASGASSTELPPLPVQAADHAVWQRDRYDGAELDRQLDHWREHLADLSTVDMPADRPRPVRPTGAGAELSRPLPADVADAARAFAREQRVSFLAVLQAGLLTVLHHWTGQTDLTIGSIFSGRTRPETEALVGYFANTLVLRTDLSGDPTFTDLTHRCHHTVLDATERQDLPFSLLVDTLEPERVPGRNPLFQISLTLQPADFRADLALGDEVVAEPLAGAVRSARFDIAIDVADAPDGLGVSVEYSTELFDADRIERLLDHLTHALRVGLADPATIATELPVPPDGSTIARTAGPVPCLGDPGATAIVTLRAGGERPPLFLVHAAGGSILPYARLAPLLGDRPVHAIEDPGMSGRPLVGDLADRAARYAAAVRRAVPDGPCCLGGWSYGGVVAVEMARLLAETGVEVRRVVALDSRLGADARVPEGPAALADFVHDLAGLAGVEPPHVDLDGLRGLDQPTVEHRVLDALAAAGLVPDGLHDEVAARMRVFAANLEALRTHRPRPGGARLLLLSAGAERPPELSGWDGAVAELEHRPVPGTHYTMLDGPNLETLAAAIRDGLA